MNDQQTMDLEGDSKTIAPSDGALTKVSSLAEKQLDLEQQLADLGDVMKELAEQLRKVQEYELPDAMDEAGVAEFKLKNGSKITVKPFYSGKITEENKENAFAWLRDRGHGDLIKHEIVVGVGRGREEDLKEIKQLLNTIRIPYNDKEAVHHSTLNAFIKEQSENGAIPPAELFNTFIGRKSKIVVK
jgi:hypothetical protein